VNDCDDHDCTRVYLSASLSPEYCHILTKVLNIFWGTVWLFELLGALRYVNYFRTYDVIFADNGPYGGMTTRGGTCVPPTVIYLPSRFRLNTIYGRRAFSVAGQMAWNSLPDFIRDPMSSTDCFRRLLITCLFARY